MGSSPEMDKFGISDADYAFMMNPLKKRYKQSKKQTIYGIFASDDSDSDAERSGLSGRHSGFKRKSANYAESITFVSGGVKLGSKIIEEPKDNSCDQISDEENDKNIFENLCGYDNSDSSGEAKPVYKSKRLNYGAGAGRRVAASDAASKSVGSGFGAWERHTKGIGMKLLEQMGYEPGKGLGPVGQGITTPVEAVQRFGKVAVGYFGTEKAPVPRRGNETVVEQNSTDTSKPRYKKLPNQTRSHVVRPKFEYRTADELVANLCPASPAIAIKKHGIFLENSEMSKVKVIDMTSKDQKIYSGYEEALSRVTVSGQKPSDGYNEDGPDSGSKRLEKRRDGHLFDCSALSHNLALVMRSAEDEIRKLDRTVRFEEDRAIGLEHDIEKLIGLVKNESTELNQLKKALDLIEKCEKEVINVQNLECGNNLTSEFIASWMSLIRQECSDMPEMPILLASVARPLLDKSLKNWKPLKEPTFCVELLSRWRDFFQNSSAFDVILETSWLSTLRRTVVSEWDPKDGEPLLDVLEAWRPLLSEEMLQNLILEQLVLPKLQNAVSSWNPLTDTIPIHTWLHPWLPWFGGVERLALVHDAILQKLGICLINWHPSDSSAHSVLMPWRSVFSVSTMSSFLNKHIVPKLGVVLQQFKLNPSKQNMDPWMWVMQWADLMAPSILVNLLEHYFWTKWLSVLSNWLSQGVDASRKGDQDGATQIFQEVGRWYAGWKGQLPPECMEFATVKSALTKALAMMERAMRGLPPQEPQTSGLKYPTNATSYPLSNPQMSSIFSLSVPIVAPPITTLRNQVEQVAAEQGLLFHPVHKRSIEGQQVYKLENLQLFFDRNVSFVHNPTDGIWHPISFTELISRAKY